jgi:hypothetical protein
MNATGESDLKKLLKTLKPKHNIGDFVFCSVNDLPNIDLTDIIMFFKEAEGNTLVLKKELADRLKLQYTFVGAWITLTVHSSLTAIGLTASFSTALSSKGISCNVVAGFFHDHIFVAKNDLAETMDILNNLSQEISTQKN